MPKISKNPDYNNLLKQIKLKVKKLEEIAVSLNFDLAETINSSKVTERNIRSKQNELLDILIALDQIEKVLININNTFVDIKKEL